MLIGMCDSASTGRNVTNERPLLAPNGLFLCPCARTEGAEFPNIVCQTLFYLLTYHLASYALLLPIDTYELLLPIDTYALLLPIDTYALLLPMRSARDGCHDMQGVRG